VQQLVNILIASELLINDRLEKFQGHKRTVKSWRLIHRLPIEQHKQQQKSTTTEQFLSSYIRTNTQLNIWVDQQEKMVDHWR